jgi:DNA-binding NarL/FixJ family response regulator
LFTEEDSPAILKEALRLGLSGYLCPPLRTDDILDAVGSSLQKATRTKEWVLHESRRATGHLQQRVNELEILSRLGQSITAQLDTDITDRHRAAVELTGAKKAACR